MNTPPRARSQNEAASVHETPSVSVLRAFEQLFLIAPVVLPEESGCPVGWSAVLTRFRTRSEADPSWGRLELGSWVVLRGLGELGWSRRPRPRFRCAGEPACGLVG